MDDFTIKFDMSSPIRWSNPAGTTPALYDPENNPGRHPTRGHRHRDSNRNAEYHNTYADEYDDLRARRHSMVHPMRASRPCWRNRATRRINMSANKTSI